MKTNKEKFLELVDAQEQGWTKEISFILANKETYVQNVDVLLDLITHLKENDISQKTFAEMMGSSPQNINKLLRGKGNLQLKTIRKIEKVLGITLLEPSTKLKATFAGFIKPFCPFVEYKNVSSLEKTVALPHESIPTYLLSQTYHKSKVLCPRLS